MPSNLPELHIGELTALPGKDRAAIVAYDTARSVVIAHSPATTPQAASLLEAMALQLLTLHPAGACRLALFEPQPSPQFGHLKRLFALTHRRLGEQLVGDGPYHRHLAMLSELAHHRFALFATLGVQDIAQYHAHPSIAKAKGAKTEVVHYLLVSSVLAPSGRDGDLLALQTLCSQGPKVGIVPLLLRGPAEEEEAAQEHGRKPLQAFWADVGAKGFGFDWRGKVPKPVNQFAVYWRTFAKFGVQVGVSDACCNAWVQTLADSVAQKRKTSLHQDFIRVPIGEEGHEPVYFCMGEASGAYNALVGGNVDSGKSSLVHNVLINTCEAMPPEDLRLWIVDLSGAGFAPYEGLPHVHYLWCALDVQEPLLLALDTFEDMWNERAQALKTAGADNIVEYNQMVGRHMPRCILVVDEVHVLLANRWAKDLITRIAKAGRKYGLHMMLITPSFQGQLLDSSVKGQIPLRIACKLDSEAASTNLFGYENPAAAYLDNGPENERRMAVYNPKNGDPMHNHVIQLYNAPKAERLARMDALRRKYPNPPPAYQPPEEPTVPDLGAAPKREGPTGLNADSFF